MPRITISLPDQFVFATELPVRISDINYGNHVGNDAILSLVHEGRLRFLAQFGYTEMDLEGTGLLMVDAAVQYKAQSVYADRLRIEITTDAWTFTGFDVLYRITHADTGREVARVKTGMRFFNYATGKIVRAPARVRERLEADEGRT